MGRISSDSTKSIKLNNQYIFNFKKLLFMDFNPIWLIPNENAGFC